MGLIAPSAGRIFNLGSDPPDVVTFGRLSPLADGAPWSVIAMVRPQQTSWHGGIVSRRNGFEAGKNQFSFWLTHGAITAGADAVARQSTLAPALDQWSIIGASLSAERSDFFVGSQSGAVVEERLPGLLSGSSSGELPFRVGRLGDGFPGLLGYVCLYSLKLHALTMRSACAGAISPLGIPGLAFAWVPGPAGDIDAVSKRAGMVSGTRFWSAAHAGVETPVAEAPSAPEAEGGPGRSRAGGPKAAPISVPADTAFLLAGHSHMFALGASPGYKGGVGLQPVAAGGVKGAFLMEQWSGSRTPDYWAALAESAAERAVFIVYNGNQHQAEFLFSAEAFDFLESDSDVVGEVRLVPRQLVRAHFARTLIELNDILAALSKAGAGKVHVVATPPPKPDLRPWLDVIRNSAYFKAQASRRGIEISEASLTAPAVMLKMWRILQELMRETAQANGAAYLPVPQAAVDAQGFLKREYHADASHANREYGELVMQAIGGAMGADRVQSV
jgi:hypothetical protein